MEKRALQDGLESATERIAIQNAEIDRLVSMPPDTAPPITITNTITLPPDTVPMRIDSWVPTKKGWVVTAGSFVLGIVVRSLFEKDDSQSVFVERREN